MIGVDSKTCGGTHVCLALTAVLPPISFASISKYANSKFLFTYYF